MIPLFDDHRRERLPLVTLLLILLNLAVFGYQLFLFGQGELDGFVREYAFTPAAFVKDPAGRSVTVLTSMFMHGGWMHLIFNLWFLWLFGGRVEAGFGGFRYLFLYVLSGVGAMTAQFVAGPGSAVPMLGASGAIAGVLGAYLLCFPGGIIFTFVPIWFMPVIPVPAFVYLVFWFAVQVWNGIGSVMGNGETGGIAWWAHFGGFVAGFEVARRLRRKRSVLRRVRRSV